ncbi:carboxypeptidase-like regulatory domain-containing protein [Pelagicoccus sp. SDUM812002]|uniref:carboxypeptidase-like regulatory domain-containing protein n=1 Tax=Pelagicoccus sp. SDUM812002 TaxID=3041266 RepID=UPI00280FEC98|nr:carboxypeptidase-like regulatory domain-containing protein [Pelagicoccus sp. SDUM812002]MDQ8186389.1 carboxypeptidase-like regulatory domain-containing protein [Pelagicoccus sp. SDUM812002]
MKRDRLFLGIFGIWLVLSICSMTDAQLTMPREESRAEELKRYIESINVPISFWGRLVDENGKGIAGADVVLRVRGSMVLPDGSVQEKVEDHTVQTDAAGRFSLVGKTGSMLGLESIEKAGYTFASRQLRNFSYTREDVRLSTELEPRVFVAIRDLRDTKLFFAKYKEWLPWDGEPVRLDLRNGVVSDGGDLLIIAEKGAVDEEGYRYDWTFRLDALGGGVRYVKEGEVVMVAPVEGYAPEWKIGYGYADKDYRGGVDGDFFVRSEEGWYARIRLTATPDHVRPSARNLFIRVFINETGGRVLQDGSTNSEY